MITTDAMAPNDPTVAPQAKIIICHWTNSGYWNQIEVSENALNGHDNHNFDIWPPVPNVTEGKNWGRGEEVYNNGCETTTHPSPTESPEPTPPPTTDEPSPVPTATATVTAGPPTLTALPTLTGGPTATVTLTPTATATEPCPTPASIGAGLDMAIIALALIGAGTWMKFRSIK